PAPDPEAELPDPGLPDRASAEPLAPELDPLLPEPAVDPLEPKLPPDPLEPPPEPPSDEPGFPESPHASTRIKPAATIVAEMTFRFMS
ncbi:MAG: hypothetical protein M3O50_14395, partial [Myxococcota bacterium]|nr:hypothetical protein [Myxococcota bacterium]